MVGSRGSRLPSSVASCAGRTSDKLLCRTDTLAGHFPLRPWLKQQGNLTFQS